MHAMRPYGWSPGPAITYRYNDRPKTPVKEIPSHRNRPVQRRRRRGAWSGNRSRSPSSLMASPPSRQLRPPAVGGRAAVAAQTLLGPLIDLPSLLLSVIACWTSVVGHRHSPGAWRPSLLTSIVAATRQGECLSLRCEKVQLLIMNLDALPGRYQARAALRRSAATRRGHSIAWTEGENVCPV